MYLEKIKINWVYIIFPPTSLQYLQQTKIKVIIIIIKKEEVIMKTYGLKEKLFDRKPKRKLFVLTRSIYLLSGGWIFAAFPLFSSVNDRPTLVSIHLNQRFLDFLFVEAGCETFHVVDVTDIVYGIWRSLAIHSSGFCFIENRLRILFSLGWCARWSFINPGFCCLILSP